MTLSQAQPQPGGGGGGQSLGQDPVKSSTDVKMGGREPRVEEVYEIGGELGKGAFSIVREARHRVSREKVAVKLIPAARFRANERAMEVVEKEIEAMQRIKEKIQHPSLVRMLELFRDDAKIALVLEHLAGGELFDRIVARGQYSEKDASQLVYKLCSALQECHRHGILHRDMKPENCIYATKEEDSEIKITDFGLALLDHDRPYVERHLVGTPGYVAPEVLERYEYGPGCDVWSTGVILYILLVGYPPFYAGNQAALFEIIKSGQYFFHPDAWDPISAEAKDLVRRMLTVDTRRRITMDGVLEHPWVCQLADVPSVHLPATLKRLKTFNAKRKWRAAAMVCMIGARFALRSRLRAVVGDKRSFTAAELERLKEAFRRGATQAAGGTATGEAAAAAAGETGGVGGGGGVTKERFSALLAELGFGELPADRMFELFDKDGNGTVDYKEFLTGMNTLRSDGDESLRFCFDVYDADGSGSISLQELKDVLFTIAGDERQELQKAGKLAKIFEKLDVNHDGEITYEEFKAGIQGEPLLVDAFLKPLLSNGLGGAPTAGATGGGGGACSGGHTAGSLAAARTTKPATAGSRWGAVAALVRPDFGMSAIEDGVAGAAAAAVAPDPAAAAAGAAGSSSVAAEAWASSRPGGWAANSAMAWPPADTSAPEAAMAACVEREPLFQVPAASPTTSAAAGQAAAAAAGSGCAVVGGRSGSMVLPVPGPLTGPGLGVSGMIIQPEESGDWPDLMVPSMMAPVTSWAPVGGAGGGGGGVSEASAAFGASGDAAMALAGAAALTARIAGDAPTAVGRGGGGVFDGDGGRGGLPGGPAEGRRGSMEQGAPRAWQDMR